MAKFIFTGDPNVSDKERAQTPDISYANPLNPKKPFAFSLNGPAVDVPEWLAKKLANSNHFRAADKADK